MNFQGGSIRERERASIERERQRKGERERESQKILGNSKNDRKKLIGRLRQIKYPFLF
jgi:hypothetical protein